MSSDSKVSANPRVWLCLSIPHEERQYANSQDVHDDDPSLGYPYDSKVPNHKQIAVGDLMLIRSKQKITHVGKVGDISKIENATKIFVRCPKCDQTAIHRKGDGWQCNTNCKHEFTEPKLDPKPITKFLAEFVTSIPNALPIDPNSIKKQFSPTPDANQMSIVELRAEGDVIRLISQLTEAKTNTAAIPNQTFTEGARRKRQVERAHRDPNAKDACIRYHKSEYKCLVCETKLRDTYGDAAAEIIHVHHIIPISRMQGPMTIDATKDLIPVCPNCHAVIHSKKEEYSVDEVRTMIKKTKPQTTH